MAIFAFLVILVLGLRLFIVTINALSRPFLPQFNQGLASELAVLIPVRNEAGQIGELLTDLQELDPKQVEIHVLDDHSTDPTHEVVSSYQSVMPNLNLFRGQPLPAGWLGKNWACHQLANTTSAPYLLFLDADVRLKPALIPNAVAFLRNHNLALLSLFPRQVVKTLGERLIIPIVYQILLTFLPLRLVEKSGMSSLAAANGQFMLFEGAHYRQHQWHKQVKTHKVEDIAIMQEIKKQGDKGAALLSGKAMECRMYRGGAEAIEGFSKNFLAFFGDSAVLAVAYSLFGAIGILFLIGLSPFWGSMLLLVEILLVRSIINGLTGYRLIQQMVLAPLQMVLTPYLALSAIWKRISGNNQWKGRTID